MSTVTMAHLAVKPRWSEEGGMWACPHCPDNYALSWGPSTRYRIGDCRCGYKHGFRHPFGIVQTTGKPEVIR